MPNNSNNPKPKVHIRPFWSITIIATVAAVLGGIIYFYGQGTELNDDIYSISFTSPVQLHKQIKKPVLKPVAKTPVKTSTSAATTTK